MAYLLNKTDGTLLINLVDGTADGPDINPGQNASDLDLFGKNYPLYGQFLDENFVRLLQNFANNTAPTKPLTGELWYDTGTGFLKVYTGTAWKLVSPVIVANTAPTSNTFGSVVGTQWWDAVNYQLNTWNGASWTLIGPAYKQPDGLSGAIVEDILDTVGQTHTVIKFYHNNSVVAISSYDAAFTISPANPVTGFSSIAPGLTLATGIANEVEFIGSATNSKMLGNVVAANYARTDIVPTFSSNILIANGNISIDSAPSGTARYYNNVLNANVSIWVNTGGTPTAALRVVGTDASTVVYGNLVIQNNKSLTAYGVTSTGATGTGQLVFSASPTFTGTLSSETLSASNILNSSLTSGRVVYSSAGGAETDSSLLTFDGSTLGAGNLIVANNASIGGNLAVTGHVTLEGRTSTGATGTGQLVFNASPTITGTLTAEAISFNGNLTASQNINLNSGTVSINATTGDIATVGNLQVGNNITIYGATPGGVTGVGNIVLNFSPTLTGTPIVPTASTATSTTQIASTEFVKNAIPAATNALWLGSSKTVSTNLPNDSLGNNGDFWFQI